VTNNEDVMGGRRKLHNEELHDFHSSVYRYRMGIIKSRRKHVARPWKRGEWLWWRKLKGRICLEELAADG
jgi:hypothetical protein